MRSIRIHQSAVVNIESAISQPSLTVSLKSY